jgi:hypothetical protein
LTGIYYVMWAVREIDQMPVGFDQQKELRSIQSKRLQQKSRQVRMFVTVCQSDMELQE